MAFTNVQVVTPANLGTDFAWDVVTSKFKVAKNTGPSTDPSNILSAGSDGSSLLTPETIQANQITYAFSIDASTGKLKLTGSDTSVTEVPLAVIQANMDNATISADGTQITFIDKDNDRTTTIDFSTFLTAITKANSNAIALSGNGTTVSPLTASLTLDTASGNLLKVSVNGASVTESDVLALLNNNITVSVTSVINTLTVNVNGKESSVSIINSNSLSLDETTGTVRSTINGVATSLPAVKLVDTAGIPIGYVFAA